MNDTITLPSATVEQALEALEIGYDSAKAEADQFHAAMAGYKPARHAAMDADVQKIAQTITALKAALAQQAEPVAWRYKGMVGMPWSLSDDGYYISCKRDQRYIIEPLYTAPPAEQPCPHIVSTKEGTHHCAQAEQPPDPVDAARKRLTDDQLNAAWAVESADRFHQPLDPRDWYALGARYAEYMNEK